MWKEWVVLKTLYLSDLDGTLLLKNGRPSQYTIDTINTLIDEGMMFSYSTARSLASSALATAELKINMPVIVNSGVFVRNPVSGEILSQCAFSRKDITDASEYFLDIGILPIVYSFIDGKECVSWLIGTENDGIAHYLSRKKNDKRLRKVFSQNELFEGEIFYFTCIGEKSALTPVFEHFSKDIRFRCIFQRELYRPEYWCEIMPKGASKASGIKRLGEIVKFDKIITFGDSINDIPMFEISDECYAVENAVPELKKYASSVIKSNSEDGVARWLYANADLG